MVFSLEEAPPQTRIQYEKPRGTGNDISYTRTYNATHAKKHRSWICFTLDCGELHRTNFFSMSLLFTNMGSKAYVHMVHLFSTQSNAAAKVPKYFALQEFPNKDTSTEYQMQQVDSQAKTWSHIASYKRMHYWEGLSSVHSAIFSYKRFWSGKLSVGKKSRITFRFELWNFQHPNWHLYRVRAIIVCAFDGFYGHKEHEQSSEKKDTCMLVCLDDSPSNPVKKKARKTRQRNAHCRPQAAVQTPTMHQEQAAY